MTVTKLMYKMASRARELSDVRLDVLDVLRATAAHGGDTYAAAVRENRHKGRGMLVEEILTDEFEEAAKKIEDFVADAEQALKSGDCG